MGVKSWFKFVTSAIAEVTTYDFSAKRLDWLVGDWGSADRSRSAEPQLAAPVVRLGPSRRAAGGYGGRRDSMDQKARRSNLPPPRLCPHIKKIVYRAF